MTYVDKWKETEITNHDCIDFVFYQDRAHQEIKVLSFVEQNEIYTLQFKLVRPIEQANTQSL